jgi:hypothetical protein
VSLFGPYNWYLPNWVGKVLRVEPSPLRAETVVGLPGGDEGSDDERELVESGERG